MEELLRIMARLRDPASGCPWDLDQTLASLAPYTLEEAHEVVDAIERGDLAGLEEELGDLLLQVAFQSQIAAEQGHFDFAAVARGICAKMVRRHPHVFGGEAVASATEQTARWEDLKAAEKAAAGKGASLMDDVPVALPALARAAKLGRRAARIGFDWPDASGPRAKIDEEIAELDAAIASADAAAIEHELGDALLAITNLARHLAVDPEQALRAANRRFETRFRHVERRAAASGASAPAELERYWDEAKADERAAKPP
jgi:tetrapyrrole methylase family protein/MazG family protein/ATP diphosphatase